MFFIILGFILILPFIIKAYGLYLVSTSSTDECFAYIQQYPYLKGKEIGDVAYVSFTDTLISKYEKQLLFRLLDMKLIFYNEGNDHAYPSSIYKNAYAYPVNKKGVETLCKLNALQIIDGAYPRDKEESDKIKFKYNPY